LGKGSIVDEREGWVLTVLLLKERERWLDEVLGKWVDGVGLAWDMRFGK